MLAQRLVGAAILVPVVVAAFLAGDPWIVGLVLLITVVATIETFTLLRAAGLAGYEALGLLLTFELVVLAATGSTALLAAAIPGTAVVLGAVAGFRHPEPRDGLVTWLATAFGAVYVGMLALLVWILRSGATLDPAAQLAWLGGGRGWLLVLVAGVWAYDSCAYAAGRAFGRRRFLVHISPSKTYAGLVGGLIGGTALVAVALAALGRSPAEALVVGPLVGLTAQAGDLAESMLKRAAGAKDSGRLIPGHGGMLDRVDSFLFAAPALAIYVAATLR